MGQWSRAQSLEREQTYVETIYNGAEVATDRERKIFSDVVRRTICHLQKEKRMLTLSSPIPLKSSH